MARLTQQLIVELVSKKKKIFYFIFVPFSSKFLQYFGWFWDLEQSLSHIFSDQHVMLKQYFLVFVIPGN